MRRRFWLAVAAAAVGALCSAAPAYADNMYNYGFDWTAAPFNDVNLFDDTPQRHDLSSGGAARQGNGVRDDRGGVDRSHMKTHAAVAPGADTGAIAERSCGRNNLRTASGLFAITRSSTSRAPGRSTTTAMASLRTSSPM